MNCIFMAAEVLGEESSKTINVTFSDFPVGVQYEKNERHDLGDGLIIYTTGCYFTSELRIYSSSTNNGYVVSDPLPGTITQMTFKAAYESSYAEDKLDVFGSVDGSEWTLIKSIPVEETSYRNLTVTFPSSSNYACFKLDVKGTNQIRIRSMSVTYVSNGESDEETIVVSTPIFNPGSSIFSSETLDVTLTAAEGCEIYYTTDGSVPSYTTADEYNGTKGSIVTISASSSSTTIKAIAVDSTTGDCSIVSSATYTYRNPSITNEGTKTKPYTVAEVKGMVGIEKGVWVKGIIYGTMVDEDITKGIATSDFEKQWNIVIGDATTHIPVQLQNNTIRSEINLKGNPYLKGKEILIKGDIESYCNSQGVTNLSEYIITYDVPINSYGYASLFLDMNGSLPADDATTAYYCTLEDNYADMFSVGSIIPNNIGVIIQSTPNTTCKLTYTTKTNADKDSILVKNLLKGFTQDTFVEADGNAYYALNAKNGRVGFYIPQTTTDNTTDVIVGFTAKAYKAYLQVPAEQKAPMFLIRHKTDETTIVPITRMSDDVIYDLQGRIVSSPTTGIYIKAGKKFVIK